MTMTPEIKFALMSLIPTVLTCFFIGLNKFTPFKKLPRIVRQIVYGICFGGVAILGTEYGIPINGAQMNTRDAAVLVAGLLFGPVSGIIAGLIGGIERWFAVFWGIGTFTRVACSVSTIIAGFYAAALRQFMFEDKKPSPFLAFAIGLVCEVFHMTMVFLTNMNQLTEAIRVVGACSIPMLTANSFACWIATLVSTILTKERRETKKLRISQTIQRWLLVVVAIVFVATSVFVYQLQNGISNENVDDLLRLSIEDVRKDIEEASDRNLITVSYEIEGLIDKYSLQEISEGYDIAEISIVDLNGIIVDSTFDDFIGYDMASGEQSKEFMCLLGNQNEYVQEYGPISYDDSIYRKYAGVKTKDGFIQIGLDAKQFQSELDEEVKYAVQHRRIGETGYLVIANADREIVSAPLGHFYHSLDDYGFNEEYEQNVVFNENVNGEDCFCSYVEVEGYYIASIYPQEEAYKVRDIVLYANAFMEILVFALMFAMINNIIRSIVVKNMDKVNNSLDKITNGDLDEKVEVSECIEFEELSTDINKTVDKLKEYIEAASKKIDEELQYAKNIQVSSLPHAYPQDDRYDVYALMEAAKEVGGDFYDVFKTQDNTLHFMIADVSGKGIPGAMFMMRAKSVLHSFTENGQAVEEVFTNGNNSLCSGNDAGMFVTAWQGCIDLETGLVNYACAGHNPPVLKHKDGSCEYIKGRPGFVLAGMDGVKYKVQQVQMEPGDIIFLYTDGVTEATSLNKELYGEERLLRALESVDSSFDMDYLCCEVIGDVGRFVDAAPQFDDITMVALKYKGKQQ